MNIYDITPIGKPLMTRADKRKTRPAFMRWIGKRIVKALCGEEK